MMIIITHCRLKTIEKSIAIDSIKIVYCTVLDDRIVKLLKV